MGEIVDGLVNKASDATRLVDKLERQGLVTRTPSVEDRRRMIVRVTPQGRKVFARLTPRIKKAHVTQMSGLSDTAKRELVTLLNSALWGYSRD
jgi:MarR family transcriptional repressor of emrRAB